MSKSPPSLPEGASNQMSDKPGVPDANPCGAAANLQEIALASVHEAVLLQDRAGRVVLCNPAAQRLLDVPADRVIGRDARDVDWRTFYPDGTPVPASQHPSLHTLQTGEPCREVELEIRRATGDSAWVSIDTEAVYLPGSAVPQFVAISFKDITARREADLQNQRERDLALQLQSAADLDDALGLIRNAVLQVRDVECVAIYLVQPDGSLTLATHHGLSPEFLATESAYSADSPHVRFLLSGTPQYTSRPGDDCSGPQVRREGVQALGSIPIQHCGRLVAALNVASRSAPEFSQRSLRAIESIAAQVGAAIHRARSDAALQQSEARLRAEATRRELLMEACRDGIVIIDQRHRVVEANRRFAEMLGYTPEEVRSLHTWDWEAVLSELEVRRGFAALDSVSRIFETRHRRRDGSEFDVEISASGTLVNSEPLVFCVCRDIAERKQAESQRLELQARAAQSQRLEAVGRLAGGVAHDFNNILTAIFGHLELALSNAQSRRQASPSMLQVLEEVRAAAERAAGLTRQLLAFSRREAIEPVNVNLSHAVAGLEKMLRRLLPESIRITYALAASLPCMRADLGQVEQVIVNLAVNARDAMPRGGALRLETFAAELDADHVARHPGASVGPHVVLAVADTGAGMDHDVLDRIFEPFFTTKAPGSGTGLGLATVYGVVQQAGGHVAVTSSPGCGARFQVYWPVSDAGDSKPAVSPLPDSSTGKGETILLCEDDDAVRSVTEQFLRTAGYSVLPVARSIAALATASTHPRPIDLLITDVIMPDVDGRTLSDMLRKRQPSVRVLFISGYTADLIAHHGVLEPGVELLAKPFTRVQLLERVHAILDPPAEPVDTAANRRVGPP